MKKSYLHSLWEGIVTGAVMLSTMVVIMAAARLQDTQAPVGLTGWLLHSPVVRGIACLVLIAIAWKFVVSRFRPLVDPQLLDALAAEQRTGSTARSIENA